MGQFFAKDYTGAAFQIFGLAHLMAVGLIAIVNIGFAYRRGNSTPQSSRAFRYGLAAVLLVNELGWHLWHLFTGQWTLQTMLPLHLCSVMVFLSAFMLVTRNYTVYEYLYFLGIGGAFQAVLTPDLGLYGFPHFRFFQTFISHGGILTAAVYMTVVEGYRPHWRSIGRVFVGANVYMAFVGVINTLIGSNYLFIAHKPETPSLIDSLGPWPWYIVGMEVVGLITCLLLYLPFALRDRRASPVASES